MFFNLVIWVVALSLLVAAAVKSPQKALLAVKRSWKSLENILPQFVGIMFLISVMLSFLTPAMISKVVGQNTGLWGMLLTSLIGSITLVPGFIAFPLTKSLVALGAGIPQVAVLVSTLMMVGLVTLPMEIQYFGKRVALTRNGLAYVCSFIVAWVIGAIGVMVR